MPIGIFFNPINPWLHFPNGTCIPVCVTYVKAETEAAHIAETRAVRRKYMLMQISVCMENADILDSQVNYRIFFASQVGRNTHEKCSQPDKSGMWQSMLTYVMLTFLSSKIRNCTV